jgi:hypothetical protein
VTISEALELAQQIHPLDLAARMKYIEMKRDTCDGDDLEAWNEARSITRNGVTL